MHSPRACLPGGGWIIRSLDQRTPRSRHGRYFVREPRALSSSTDTGSSSTTGSDQRGRNLTNEYLVKWYIFWDALTRNRTDGALIRLSLPLAKGEDEQSADRALAGFAAQALPQLGRYVPD